MTVLLVTREQIREMDRRTIEDVGIPGIVLMERAALGAVDALESEFSEGFSLRIGLLCGGGNNGGDGFAMARLLHERGHEVWVGSMVATDQLSGAPATNLAALEALDVHVAELDDLSEGELTEVLEALPPCDVWVDALFGTGLDREVEDRWAGAILFMNTQPRVLAVDIASGLHADTGQVLGVAVRATATATFGFPKLGQALHPAAELGGSLYAVDIGLPSKIVEEVGWEAELLVAGRWVPARHPTMHKGDAGRIACLGGAPGTSGAIVLTSRAALHSGAGLLRVGTFEESLSMIGAATPEVMTTAVLAKQLEQSHSDELDDLLEWADVVAIGPGLGTSDGAAEALERALDAEIPVVADADALNIMADRHRQLVDIEPETLVMTPHPGEAARLIGCETSELLTDPVAAARAIADEWGAIVVLKGASSIVAAPDGRLAVNATGNPGMATGGMGDALTGIIAAHLMDLDDPFEAVCTAVWVHGAAGDLAAESCGHRALSASGLIEALGQVWHGLEERS